MIYNLEKDDKWNIVQDIFKQKVFNDDNTKYSVVK